MTKEQRQRQWKQEDDSALLEILKFNLKIILLFIYFLRFYYPQIFFQNKYNVKWSFISFELHKIFPSKSVKNSKAIRERWLNHLSPFLKK